jgi:hypothetical protein
MSDVITPASETKPAPSSDDGKPRRDAGALDSFAGEAGSSAPGPGKGPASGGKKGTTKKSIGRPPKNLAGFSGSSLEEVFASPDIEAARAEFEEVLTYILVATTDGIADSRYELLKTEFPEAVAKGMADKARLNEREKKYFSAVAIRIWRKYLGDKYLLSDEGIAAAYFAQYMLRNWEPMMQARKAGEKINATKSDQQSRLQAPARPDSGNNGNGKDGTRLPPDLDPSRAAGPRL